MCGPIMSIFFEFSQHSFLPYYNYSPLTNIFVNYIKKLSVLLKGGRLFFSMNSSFGKYVCDQAIEKILKPGLLPILLLGLFVEKDEVLFLANGGL